MAAPASSKSLHDALFGSDSEDDDELQPLSKRKRATAIPASARKKSQEQVIDVADSEEEDARAVGSLPPGVNLTSDSEAVQSLLQHVQELHEKEKQQETEIAMLRAQASSFTTLQRQHDALKKQHHASISAFAADTTSKQQQIDALTQQASTASSAPPAGGKGKGKAKAASSVQLDPNRSTSDAYKMLTSFVIKELAKETARLEAKHKAPAGAPATAPQPTWNCFLEDNGWITINDPTTLQELQKLIDSATTGVKEVTYSFGGNAYKTVVATVSHAVAKPGDVTLLQTNTSHHAHTQRMILCQLGPPPAAQATHGMAAEDLLIVKSLLYGAPFIKLTNKLFDDMLNVLDANSAEEDVQSDEIAELAELWSRYASGYTYDKSKSKMWMNGTRLRHWVLVAKSRKYNYVRIVMHGSTSYERMRKDQACFDRAVSRGGCAKGHALYVAVSDHIPTDYNNGSGHPNGSGVIGLLLFSNTKDTVPSAPFTGSLPSYERYRLHGHNTPVAIQNDTTNLEAISVFDQLLWTPLGLAVANK